MLNRLWFGATDRMVEGVFRWINGIEVNSFVNWAPGYPTGSAAGGGDRDCLVRHGPGGGWADVDCGETHKFYCETHQRRNLKLKIRSHV